MFKIFEYKVATNNIPNAKKIPPKEYTDGSKGA